MEDSDDAEYEAWLKTRPESVQKLAREYPPGWYRIKEGAPYGISTPGTLVQLYSYTERGEIGVVVYARHKRPEALALELMLSEGHGTPPMHEKDILVHIDPFWMKPCEVGELEEMH